MEAENLLFVYGTLMKNRGHPLHRLLSRQADFVGEGVFRGKMYQVRDYPGVVPSDAPEDRVHGEIYRLHRRARDLLDQLDPYEGCVPGSPRDSLFRRERVEILGPGGEKLRSWIYVYNRDVSGLKLIPWGRFAG